MLINAQGLKTERHDEAYASQEQVGCRVAADRNGTLFDPNNPDMSWDQTDKAHLQARRFGLVRCSEACFLAYVRYLEARNKTHYVIAQREFNNGY